MSNHPKGTIIGGGEPSISAATDGAIYYDAVRGTYFVALHGTWVDTGWDRATVSNLIRKLEVAEEQGELERADILELRMKGE